MINVFFEDNWIALIKVKFGCTCSNLFNKNTVEKAGGWNETQKSSQESELMFRMLKNECTVIVDDLPLTEVHAGGTESISRKTPLENLVRFFQLRMDFFLFLQKENKMNGERKNALSIILLGTIRMIYKYDKKTAIQFYKEQYFHSFEPVAGPGISKMYARFLSLFGFNFSEKLFSIIRR